MVLSTLRSSCAVVALWLLANAVPAFGSLIRPHRISDLQQQASLIVVGTASGSFQSGSGVFSLRVSRVVKGDLTIAGSTISVKWPAMAAVTQRTAGSATGTGLWFLLQSSGGLVLMPVVDGDVPMEMTFFPEPSGPVLAAYNYGPTAALPDKVASELCSAIESLQSAFNFQLYVLLQGDLDRLGSSVVAQFYPRLMNSGVTAQQVLGASGLIRAGSTSALAVAAQSAALFSTAPHEYGILLQAVRDSCRMSDATTVSVLGSVAVNTTQPVSFREAAAHALSAIHAVNTLPYLATLLNDPDPPLRVEAVGGLGAFANGRHSNNRRRPYFDAYADGRQRTL